MWMSKEMVAELIDEWAKRDNKKPVLAKWRMHHFDGVKEFIEWLYKKNKGTRYCIVDRYMGSHDVDKFYPED